MSRVWAKKGTRPRRVRQQQFQYAYIFGAVCPSQDVSVGLVMPTINSYAMKIHLEHITERIPEGRHAAILLDRAAWHTTSRLKKFTNLTLIPLPKASPELNPVEQLWQQLRDNDLSNCCFDGYEDIVETCCLAWNRYTERPGAIRRLCSRKWTDFDI